jgi:predicted permease
MKMTTLKAWSERIRELFHKEQLDRELSDELASHLEMHIADNLRSGMTPEEARRDAVIKLGGLEQAKESVRDRRGIPLLETLLQDARFGLRLLRKKPGFTAITVLTLALGIGATTAIFSVVYGVLLAPLPYPQPDRIVQMWELDGQGGRMNFAEPNFVDLRAMAQSFAGLAETGSDVITITGGTQATRLTAALVSRDFFKVLRVSPLLGRGFSPEDLHQGAEPVLLVSHAYWQRYLGGAPDLAKCKLVADNRVYSVVGVLPQGFDFPDGAALWAPREIFPLEASRSAHNWVVFGRLAENVSIGQARAELAAIAHGLKQRYGGDTDMSSVSIVRLQDALTGQVRPALLLLLGAVGFLLLVACANVANLLLVQAAARRQELAIRAAVGATRRMLVRQFLVESLVLCGLSCVLGVFGARWGVGVLVALAPSDLPRLHAASPNLPALLFVVSLTVFLAVGLGIFTAVRATSGNVREALGEGGRDQMTGPRGQRFARTIVAVQLATTLVLLVGAGLLGRSLLRVLSVDPGFRVEHIVTMDLVLPSIERDEEKVARVRLMNEVFSRFRNLPGVDAVAGANALPLQSEFIANGTFLVLHPGQQPLRIEDFETLARNPSITGYADYCVASDDYFRVLGIPLLRGRFFDHRDSPDAPPVAVIDDALARKRWPSEDPLGKTIEFGNMDGDLRLLTIVGVVGDARNRSLETRPTPTIYVDFSQRPQRSTSFTVVLRTALPPAPVISAAREIVHDLDPNLPPSFQTFGQVFRSSLAARRFNLILVAAFAATALLLAAAGIYGVMAHGVARRTRELGVRMALGATSGDVFLLILGQGMVTTAFGVAIGIAGSFALARTMRSLLFAVSPFDPLTLASVALLLGAVALLACWVPARRATRLAPLTALRYH